MKRIRNHERCGGAAVEVALTAPLIFLLVFGLMEWARTENIRQVASTAAFNSARLGTIPGTTTTEMETRAQDVLAIYLISDATIDATITDTESSIDISVPMDKNSWFVKRFFGNSTINRSFKLSQ
jgi:Flp pilus assembly protein TadG